MTRMRRGKEGKRRVRSLQAARDREIDKRMGKSHRFVIFRMGEDVCAKCGKGRKEHV